MCVSLFGLSINCKKRPIVNNAININLNSFNQLMKTLIATSTQSADVTTINVQQQYVRILGVPPNGPNIIINQNMNVDIKIDTNLSSKIDTSMMNSVAQDVSGQITEALRTLQNMPTPPPDTDVNNIISMRQAIYNSIKENSTLTNISTALNNSINIESQNITISFSESIPQMVAEDPATNLTQVGGRPTITINQSVFNTVLSSIAMDSLIKSITNNQAVINAASRVAGDNCIIDYQESEECTDGPEGKYKNVKSEIIKAENQGGKSCLDMAKELYPNVKNWELVSNTTPKYLRGTLNCGLNVKKNNTLLYVGIGLLILFIIIFMLFIRK
jgi:hypothetical protein